MFDKATFPNALAVFKQLIKTPDANAHCEPLSNIIQQFETQKDFEECLTLLREAADDDLTLDFHFICYIHAYHRPKDQTNKNPWGKIFQGYTANILSLFLKGDKAAQAKQLFIDLILLLYVDTQAEAEELFNWLQEECPKVENNATKIGEGTFGQLYKSQEKAIKVYYKIKLKKNLFQDFTDYIDVLNEAILLKSLKGSKYIVDIEHVGFDESPRLSMECADVGNLMDVILGEPTRLYVLRHHFDIMTQILSALIIMHQNEIAHRDLKPSNILVFKNGESGYRIKLCDLGAGTKKSHSIWDHYVVTTYTHASPNALNGETQFLDKDDIYSAAIVWAMIFGKSKNPLRYLNINYEKLEDVKKSVVAGARPRTENVPQTCKPILNLMWSKDPNNRPDAFTTKTMIEQLKIDQETPMVDCFSGIYTALGWRPKTIK